MEGQLSAADEKTEAHNNNHQLLSLLSDFGFEMLKWSSNSTNFLQTDPLNNQRNIFSGETSKPYIKFNSVKHCEIMRPPWLIGIGPNYNLRLE